jgi:hypothetical protein
MLYVIELIVAAVVLYVLISQIIVPLIRDTPTFPLWNREHRLYEELRDIHQGRIEAEVEAEVEAMKMEVERLVEERRRKNAAAASKNTPSGSSAGANEESK